MDEVRRQLHNEQVMADVKRVEREVRALGADPGASSGPRQRLSIRRPRAAATARQRRRRIRSPASVAAKPDRGDGSETEAAGAERQRGEQGERDQQEGAAQRPLEPPGGGAPSTLSWRPWSRRRAAKPDGGDGAESEAASPERLPRRPGGMRMKRPFMSHLLELRQRLLRSLLFLVFGFFPVYYFNEEIFNFVPARCARSWPAA